MAGTEPQPLLNRREPAWVTRLATARPDVVYMAPFMAYLVLLSLRDVVPYPLLPVAIVIRGVGAAAVVWLLWNHLPSFGRARVGLAIGAGIAAAALWVVGEHLFDSIRFGDRTLGGSLFKFLEHSPVKDPREGLSPAGWWTQAALRILVACTTVPVVEEIFWRGFMLRALIDWDRFEKLPLGTFTWWSFLGTSLLSTVQHPDNWAVSILCWLFYNALFIKTRSLLCLMITHGVTNLVLYAYVIRYEDWQFW